MEENKGYLNLFDDLLDELTKVFKDIEEKKEDTNCDCNKTFECEDCKDEKCPCENKDTKVVNINNANNLLGCYNIYSYQDYYLIEILVPGFSKENISIKLQDKKLVVEATKNDTNEDNEYKIYNGYNISNFVKYFDMFDDIDVDKISSKIIDGVLNIYMYKSEESKPKVIEID